MKTDFPYIIVCPILFALLLICSCENKSPDYIHLANGKAALQEYYQSLDSSQLRVAFNEYKQVHNPRLQRKVSTILLSCYLIYGEYEEGRRYYQSLTSKDLEYPELSFYYPSMYDACEYALKDSVEAFGACANKLLLETCEAINNYGSPALLLLLYEEIELFAPDSSILKYINDCYSDSIIGNKYNYASCILPVIDKLPEFEYQTDTFLNTVKTVLHP